MIAWIESGKAAVKAVEAVAASARACKHTKHAACLVASAQAIKATVLAAQADPSVASDDPEFRARAAASNHCISESLKAVRDGRDVRRPSDVVDAEAVALRNLSQHNWHLAVAAIPEGSARRAQRRRKARRKAQENAASAGLEDFRKGQRSARAEAISSHSSGQCDDNCGTPPEHLSVDTFNRRFQQALACVSSSSSDTEEGQVGLEPRIRALELSMVRCLAQGNLPSLQDNGNAHVGPGCHDPVTHDAVRAVDSYLAPGVWSTPLRTTAPVFHPSYSQVAKAREEPTEDGFAKFFYLEPECYVECATQTAHDDNRSETEPSGSCVAESVRTVETQTLQSSEAPSAACEKAATFETPKKVVWADLFGSEDDDCLATRGACEKGRNDAERAMQEAIAKLEGENARLLDTISSREAAIADLALALKTSDEAMRSKEQAVACLETENAKLVDTISCQEKSIAEAADDKTAAARKAAGELKTAKEAIAHFEAESARLLDTISSREAAMADLASALKTSDGTKRSMAAAVATLEAENVKLVDTMRSNEKSSGSTGRQDVCNAQGAPTHNVGKYSVEAARVQTLQRHSSDLNSLWHTFCDNIGDGVYDPFEHDVSFLRTWLQKPTVARLSKGI